jgi:hypothetical protein
MALEISKGCSISRLTLSEELIIVICPSDGRSVVAVLKLENLI